MSVVKKVADLIGFSLRFFQKRQHRRKGRARDAIADGVDLFLAGDLAGDANGLEITFLDILFEPHIGIARVRVLPAHDEQRVALVHDPADQAVLRLEVHDVELVDPGREDHHRRAVHGFGGGRVLDQLHHAVAEHHGAFGGRDVPAHLEGLRVGERRKQLPVVTLDIAHHVLQPLHEAHALGLHRALQCIGIGGEVIGGREQVDHLVGEKLHPRLVGLVETLKLAHCLLDRFRAQKILVLDEVEVGMCTPQRVREPLVAHEIGGRPVAR